MRSVKILRADDTSFQVHVVTAIIFFAGLLGLAVAANYLGIYQGRTEGRTEALKKCYDETPSWFRTISETFDSRDGQYTFVGCFIPTSYAGP